MTALCLVLAALLALAVIAWRKACAERDTARAKRRHIEDALSVNNQFFI